MWRLFLILIAGFGTATLQARTSLGQYQRWGAFREAPGRCFAIAEPIGGGRRGSRPYVAITRRAGGGAPRLHVELSRSLQPGSALRLEVDDRVFALDGGQDARIISAIRGADMLRVKGVDAQGRRFHDDYPLVGAPSAIDAAIVGCL